MVKEAAIDALKKAESKRSSIKRFDQAAEEKESKKEESEYEADTDSGSHF